MILVPHGLLGWCMVWLWWPKSDEGWRRFGILAVYLLVVYYFVLRKFTIY
jgi:hypothetical protein